MGTNSFINNILEVKDSLPKKQRVFCSFLLDNYQSISLESVSVMAKKSSVGTTTVLRTVKALGYENFNEFKKDIHKSILEMKTPTWWRFEKTDRIPVEPKQTIQGTWEDINYLQRITLNDSLIKNIERTVDFILESKTTHVLGLRTSKTAALYFENLINEFYPNQIDQLSYDSHFIFDKMYHFKDGDLLVIFALSPFTKISLEAAKYCHELGHSIILITDDNSCSIIPYSKIVLHTIRKESQYTIVPVISLIETLTIALGRKTADNSANILDEIGKLLVEKEITTL